MTTIKLEQLHDVVGGKTVDETCKVLRDGKLYSAVGDMVGKYGGTQPTANPATLESTFAAAQSRVDAWAWRCNDRGNRAEAAGFSGGDLDMLLRNTR